MNDKKSQLGFGLVETLIASMILASLTIVFYGVGTGINRNTALANERAKAALVAQAELENLKYAREQTWKDSRSLNSTVADWDETLKIAAGLNGTGCTNWTPISDTIYEKQICLDRDGANKLPLITVNNLATGQNEALDSSGYRDAYYLATVKIRWQGVRKNNEYTLRSIITNWQPAML